MTITQAPPAAGWLDQVIKAVRDDDAARPRSTQQEIGWSELGGCRSALGFRLEGAWASDETDNWSATRGTALHAHLEAILGGSGIRTEVDTVYRNIPGHADLVGPDWIGDIKTKTLAGSRLWQSDQSAFRQARIQVNGYAAGLIDAGELPGDATIRLLIIPVDGGYADWWAWEEPFDRSLADEGADRLDDVRARIAAGEPLPKDKPYQWCTSYCQFFSLCRAQDDPAAAEEITDPDLAAAVAAYGEATAQINALYKDKDRLAEMIRGLRGTAGDWRISLSKPGESRWVLDEDRVRHEYEVSGRPLPVAEKPGSAPRLNVTRIRKAAAR